MEYDWVLQNLANPTFNPIDFRAIGGMTTDNTQFKPFDYYSSSPRIQSDPQFQDASGNYNEDLFRGAYIQMAQRYAEFADDELGDNYEYSYYDPARPANARIHNQQFQLGAQSNPNHITVGIGSFNEGASSGSSIRELAQQSDIIDSRTGQSLNYSVNDMAATVDFTGYLKSWFRKDPLVYATYDKDTLEKDPYTGLMVQHFKGEYKLNDKGEYYVETLGDQSLLGKEVVSAFDYLTVDGSGINKYDFFDADGLDKSTVGTVMRSVAIALPIFLPGIGTLYSSALLARSIAEIAPMAYGVVSGLVGASNVENKYLNTLSAWAKQLSPSQSDYDRAHVFTWNNIANMAGDFATIFGSQAILVKGISRLAGSERAVKEAAYAKSLQEYQRAVSEGLANARATGKGFEVFAANAGAGTAKGIQDLIRTGTWQESPYGIAALAKYVPAAQQKLASMQKLGQEISLGYFALVLNTDFFDELRLRGVNDREAALMTLGSIIGIYSVDKYLHLGQIFYRQPELLASIRATGRKEAEVLSEHISQDMAQRYGVAVTQEEAVNFLQRGVGAGQRIVNNFWNGLREQNLPYFSKIVGEGLMRASEEAVHDVTRSLASVAGEMGYFNDTDYGQWENFFERYAMTYLGGALGGAVFGAGEHFKIGKHNKANDVINDAVYMVRQGRKNELIDIYKQMYDHGQLGSKKLSYNVSKEMNAEGKHYYLQAQTEEDSQAYYIYQQLVKNANDLDVILNQSDINVDDPGAFDKLVQGEYRARVLSLFLRGKGGDNALATSYSTYYYDRVQELAAAIGEAGLAIKALRDNATDVQQTTEVYKSELKALEDRLSALNRLRNYLFSEGSLGFIEMMLWAMDTKVSSFFIETNFEHFLYSETGATSAQYSPALISKFRQEYDNVMAHRKQNLYDAFIAYKTAGEWLQPEIKKLGDAAEAFKARGSLEGIINYQDPFNWNSKIEGEEDAVYAARDKKGEHESDDAFEKRKQARQDRIDELNKAALQKHLEELAKEQLTRSEQRRVLSSLTKSRFGIAMSYFSKKLKISVDGLKNVVLDIIAERERNRSYDWEYALEEKIRDIYTKQIQAKYGGDPMHQITFWEDALDMYNERPGREGKDNASLTFRDVYEMVKMLEPEAKAEDVRGIMRDFSMTSHMRFDDTTIPGKRQLEAAEFVEAVIRGEKELTDSDADKIAFVRNDIITAEVEAKVGPMIEEIKRKIGAIDSDIDQDSMMSALKNMERMVILQSPVVDILKKVVSRTPGVVDNLDTFLSNMFNMYNELSDRKEFQLTQQQIDTINDFINDLKVITAYIHAAREPIDPDNEPLGHNYAMNDYVQNHRDVYPNADLLPTIKNDDWAFLVNEIDSYVHELNAWLYRAERNSNQLANAFIAADSATNTMRKTFWSTYRESVRNITFGDKNIDLLEGYEKLIVGKKGEEFYDAYRVEQLVHLNFMRHYKEATDKKGLLKAIFDKVFSNESGIANLSKVAEERSGNIDGNTNVQGMTHYDTAMYFIATLGVNNEEFYSNIFEHIERLRKKGKEFIPLTPQEYQARINFSLCSHVEDGGPGAGEIVNTFFEYVKEKTGIKLPIIKNTGITPGCAGGGKSSASIPLSIKLTDVVWISGPQNDQIIRLREALSDHLDEGKIVNKSMADLFKEIYGDSSEIGDNLSNNLKDPSDKVYRQDGTTPEGNDIIRIEDAAIKSIRILVDNKPDVIVVDEATWLNTPQLLILGEFAAKNGIRVYLAGDERQNGIITPKYGNMDREYSLALRSPRLNKSIRARNDVKWRNQDKLGTIIDDIQSAATEAETAAKKISIEPLIGKLQLEYYHHGNEFAGDIIVDTIDTDLINSLKIEGEQRIAFIGDENDPIVDQLRNAYPDKVDVKLPSAIQGGEYEYVVIKKKWHTNFDPSNDVQYVIGACKFFMDVNTMITRSAKGSIIIDDGNIGKIIKNKKVTTTGVYTGFRDAAIKFAKQFNDRYETIKGIKLFIDDTPATALRDKDGSVIEADGKGVPPTSGTGSSLSKTPEVVDKAVPTLTDGSTETEPTPKEEQPGTPPTEESQADENFTENTETPPPTIEPRSEQGALPPGPEQKLLPPPPDPSSTVDTPPGDLPGEEPTLADVYEPKVTGIKGTPVTPLGDESDVRIEYHERDEENRSQGFGSYYEHVNNGNTPIRAYGNVTFSGVSIIDFGEGKDKYTIWKKSFNNTDLDIFMPEDAQYGKDNGAKKDELVTKLLGLKSYFLYSTEKESFYELLPREIKRLFSENSLKNAKYLIRSRKFDAENGTNRLVGLTDLENGEDAEALGTGKRIITLVAQIERTVGGKTQYYYVTLGALGSPEKWKNTTNAASIQRALQRSIEAGQDPTGTKAQYLTNFNDITDNYEEFINSISQYDIDIEIARPNISAMTAFVSTGETPLRMQNVHNSGKPYEQATRYAKHSDIFVINDPSLIPGVDESLRGAKAMFVTSNTLISNDTHSMLERYKLQKQRQMNGETGYSESVRLAILDSTGVPFKDLWNISRNKEIFSMGLDTRLNFTVPLEYGPTGFRMFMAMWNFRTALKQFNRAYRNWKQEIGVDDKWVTDTCKLENDVFRRIHVARGDKWDDENERWDHWLPEEEMRRIIDESRRDPDASKHLVNDDEYNRLTSLWEFNNGREYGARLAYFRVGYSENGNGLYERRLINTTQSEFYKEYRKYRSTSEQEWNGEIIGTYINPELAEQYENAMDILFNDVIGHIIPIEKMGISDWAFISEKSQGMWYYQFRNKGGLYVDFVNEEDGTTITRHIKSDTPFLQLAIAMIELGKRVELVSKDLRASLKKPLAVDKNRGIKYSLAWYNILSALKAVDRNGVERKGMIQYSKSKYEDLGIAGVVSVRTEEGTGQIDRRLDHMFSVMFHGLTSTRVLGEFGHGELQMTGVRFPYGFFADAIYAAKPKDGTQPIGDIVLVATNQAFFSTDVKPAFPLIGIPLEVVYRWQRYLGGDADALKLPEKVTNHKQEARNIKLPKNSVLAYPDRENIQGVVDAIKSLADDVIDFDTMDFSDCVNDFDVIAKINMAINTIQEDSRNDGSLNGGDIFDIIIRDVDGQLVYQKRTIQDVMKSQIIEQHLNEAGDGIIYTLEYGTRVVLRSIEGFKDLEYIKPGAIIEDAEKNTPIKSDLDIEEINMQSPKSVQDEIRKVLIENHISENDKAFKMLNDRLAGRTENLTEDELNELINDIEESFNDNKRMSNKTRNDIFNRLDAITEICGF